MSQASRAKKKQVLKSQTAAGTLLDSAKVLWFVRTKSAKLVGLTPWGGLLTDDTDDGARRVYETDEVGAKSLSCSSPNDGDKIFVLVALYGFPWLK